MKRNCLTGLLTVVLCWLALLAAPVAAAPNPLAADEQNRLLTEAVQFCRQADSLAATDADGAQDLYRKALLRYTRLEAAGIKNGRLYYNLGNLHFRLHDLGRALLNYRRAELFMPADGNLRQNLAYVRELRRDRIEEQEQTQVLKTLFFWHYDLTPEVRLGLGGFFYLAFWGLVVVYLFRPGLVPRSVPALSLAMALLFMGSLLVDYRAATGQPAGVLISPEIVARKGGGPAYQPSFQEPLHGGTEFRLLERRGDWWRIMLGDGRDCWIPAAAGELVLPGPAV